MPSALNSTRPVLSLNVVTMFAPVFSETSSTSQSTPRYSSYQRSSAAYHYPVSSTFDGPIDALRSPFGSDQVYSRSDLLPCKELTVLSQSLMAKGKARDRDRITEYPGPGDVRGLRLR